MTNTLRPLRLPDDYSALAKLLNTHWSEPTSAERLEEDDAKLYEVGVTYKDDNGQLAGYDRTRYVAVTEQDEIVGFVWSWRAPWTEPGALNNTLIVAESYRNQGVGQLLLRHAAEWGTGLGATKLYAEIWDDSPDSLGFVKRRGFTEERQSYQSVLDLGKIDFENIGDDQLFARLASDGVRFSTLADEPDDGELKLYELYKGTLVDIPGFTGEVPVIDEWRKWYLQADGYAPEQVIIAVAGDKYAGVTNVLHNKTTNGMYHEYTGVGRNYRGRGIARALKLKAIRLARQRDAAYIRTDNDSTNAPILRINQSLGYVPLRGMIRIVASLADVIPHTLKNRAPRIEGDGIVLRYARESDLESYLAFLRDPEMSRLTGSQAEFTTEQITAWIRKISVPNDDRADFVIALADTDEVIGEVVLNEVDSDNRSANIRIAIQGNSHRGKGYGTQAMIHMLRHGFETLRLHRIHLGVYAFNPRAIHVYEKLGFRREGVERDALYQNGEFHDMIMMAMLEEEYRSLYGVS
ncbi:GNAT family N-acetyltransferase [Cohnella lupini]|uniref:RimJ/RimL family protein N-acetyltransferase n=1 Tax=Cohnella lupini TaxID=1294267 RepID=A0A3D9I8W1_9BACL|nr:GNAT family N-acetyltransferase [Cohnella lupini]RED58120.1 RimJ/RimL family protein N-acetyltransferase [Cohnella lupini]